MRMHRDSLRLLALLPLLAPLPAGADDDGDDSVDDNGDIVSPLVRVVRQSTARFQDVQEAVAEGYEAGPCVSGPNEGAMGVHYVNGSLLGDGVVDATQPEALIYEPLPNGRLRLVGVEFLALMEAWDAANTTPAILEGHLFNLIGSPNRYRLPAFYELHVWAWQENPNGTFSDWNPLVSCDAFSPT